MKRLRLLAFSLAVSIGLATFLALLSTVLNQGLKVGSVEIVSGSEVIVYLSPQLDAEATALAARNLKGIFGVDHRSLLCSEGVASMLCLVMATNSATILREARTQAGLSRRALATRAGVATSTVSRIEEGESDPTFMMLRRLVSAAGRDLVVDSQPRDERPTLAELSTALDEHADSLKIDWTRLRGFVDWVEHHPDELADAIAEPPATNARLMKAVLAALAEQLADEHGVERPRWTRTVEHLTEPWVPPATSRMRASFEASAPEPFSRRNVILPRSALFRSKA